MSDDLFDDYYEDEDEYINFGSNGFKYQFGTIARKRVTTPYYKLSKKEQLRMNPTTNGTTPLYWSNFHVNDLENFGKILLDQYIKNHNPVENAIQVGLFIHPNKTLFEFIEILKKKMNTTNIVVNFNQPGLIEVYNDNTFITLNLVSIGNNADMFEANKELGIELVMYGQFDTVKKIYKDFRKKYILNNPVATWLFRDSDGSIQGSDFDLANPSPVYKEYYPYIPEFETFSKRFMESSASVLVLYGIPGGGKTSFIRNMLVELNEGCLTTFDDTVMQSDKLYIRFLNNYHKFLVLEDAETVLLDRETDNNKVMSKILSASDGLVRLDNKKMIFTTNITDISRIDQALIREGRCFEAINFRELTRTEAEAACKKIGKPMPDDDRNFYSLAQLFNSNNGTHKKEKVKMGFGR